MSSVEVHVPFIKKWKKKIKKEVKPRTAKPNPKSHYGSTKRNFKACGKLFVLLCSSYICFVAIFIPIFPAKAEKKAPKTKATTINICVVGTK
jgi:hypothetical protein